MFTQLLRVADPYHDLHALSRHMDAVFSQSNRARRRSAPRGFDVFDDGETYRLVADLPGLSADDLKVDVTEDEVTIRGERKTKAPEGFKAVRRERADYRVARSFSFPTKVDPANVEASLDDGVLTITRGKRADAKPRSITVRTAA